MPTPETAGREPIPEYANNPFIERLPPILPMSALQATYDRPPLLTPSDLTRPPEERLHIALRLRRYSQPTVAARELGRRIEQMVRQGYIHRNPNNPGWLRGVEFLGTREAEYKSHASSKASPKALANVLDGVNLVDEAPMSMLVFGPPGVGKTHAVAVSLSRYKPVIKHTTPCVLTQIIWLRMQCPPTGSLVTLCAFFFAAVDEALRKMGIQSGLADQYKRATIGTALVGMARVANLYGIGVLVIDEIQHVKTAHKEWSALLNFLVTLQNSIGIPLVLIGTGAALTVVQRTFRDARRADGLGSILFDRLGPAPGIHMQKKDAPQPIYGEEFATFVKKMWRWQYTNTRTDLDVDILNALFVETQGIIDLIVKLFILVQMRLIGLSDARCDNIELITPRVIHEVAKHSFHAVRPFINAIRDNDPIALALHEDLIGTSEWFQHCLSEASEYGIRDEDHGDRAPFPPMAVAGAIDTNVLDLILEGFGVSPARRGRIIAEHAGLIEAGDLAGLVAAIKTTVQAAADQQDRKPRTRERPIEGDVRELLKGAKDASEIIERIGVASLDTVGPAG